MKILIYAVILSLTTQVYARGGDHKGFKMLDDLNLTSAQLEKVEIYKQERKKKREVVKTEKKNHREQMKNLFIAGAPDSELRKLHESIKKHRGKHADRKLEKMIFLKNLLTKEQRTAYIANKKDDRKKCKGKKHRNK